MESFQISIATVAIAEMGDRTQLLVRKGFSKPRWLRSPAM